MWKQIYNINKTDRKWHLPFIAGICIAIPMILGIIYDHVEEGKIASIAALVILYLQSKQLTNRMVIMMLSGFGFIFSFIVGTLFSNFISLAPILLALYAGGIHYALHKLQLTKPPGNFFFIMVASVAVSLPNQSHLGFAEKIGYFTLGVILTCIIAFIYSLITLQNNEEKTESVTIHKNIYVNITESMIFGVFVGIALGTAQLLELENNYWVVISCLAIMQGITTKHVVARTVQRILGTFVGLGFMYLVLQFNITPISIGISIFILQIVVEYFIVRNYGLSVIFITMLTIFLAEPSLNLVNNGPGILLLRFYDTVLGAGIGAIGGWLLYNQKIHYIGRKHIRKTKVIINRK